MHRLQELVRLHRMGLPARQIASELGMGPNTERRYRHILADAGSLAGEPGALPELEVLCATVESAARLDRRPPGAWQSRSGRAPPGSRGPTPTPERLTAVLAKVHKAVAEDDDLAMDPALAACVQLALAGPHEVQPEPATRPPLTVSAFGMQLHAATTVDGRYRKQLERLCRYMLRPPFAHDAVKALGGACRAPDEEITSTRSACLTSLPLVEPFSATCSGLGI